MAQIVTSGGVSVFQIQRWLGLNESPDGDTGLQMGEAALMRNFRISSENNLQIRPGYAPICTLSSGARVRGMWSGYVDGVRHLLAACGGHLWNVKQNPTGWAGVDLGAIDDEDTTFFGFAKKVYLLTGSEYYCWDGQGSVAVVEGYVPLLSDGTPPEGGGTLMERKNLLSSWVRQRYSPDGTSTAFKLATSEVDEVKGVEGTEIKYTLNKKEGKVEFESPPEKGAGTLTITWRKGHGDREKVTAMRFSEFYNGASDSRVFLYGDGTNRAIYSDLDDKGQPTADYFPDLNVMAVDSANTPITAMIRHYDRLLVYKTDSAYSAQYSPMTLGDGKVTAAFSVSPLNREIGCGATGQVRLVSNDPRTLFGRGVYQWGLATGSSRDERNAKRISARVEGTLATFDLGKTLVFDDEERQEYYVVDRGRALVHNYGVNVWYYYDHFPATCMEALEGEVYFGTQDGRLMHLSSQYRNDDKAPIDARWESGSMDFGQDWKRKYSATLWVSIKPESQGRVTVTAQSNLKSNYGKKVVSSGLASYVNTSFAHWSFGTNRKPQVRRVKLKIKKFTYYTLIFESKSVSATATVLGVDMDVRYTGNVK